MDLSDASLVTPDALRRIFAMLKRIVFARARRFVEILQSAGHDGHRVLRRRAAGHAAGPALPAKRGPAAEVVPGHVPGLIDKVKLVVNRSTQESETIRLKRAEEIVGREFFWQVPNDYRLMVEVRNNGVPLIEHAPKAEITQSLLAFPGRLCGEEATSDKPAKPARSSAPGLGKWFGFLSSARRQILFVAASSPQDSIRTRDSAVSVRLSFAHHRWPV